MRTEEVWSDILDFPDYQVSNHGRIGNKKTGQLLKPVMLQNGYLTVKLYNASGGYQKYIARLVAESFLLDYRENVRIGFVDGDSVNCHVNNLLVRGDRVRYFREQPARQTGRRVRIVETEQVFRSVHKCATYINGDPRAIYKVLRGVQHSHLGYRFEWLNVEQSLKYARLGKLL